MKTNLSSRLLKFSIDTIKFLRKLPNTTEYKVIKHQLIKSSSSSGANYEESQGACSKADFINKVFIALKEMRESNYWLNILSGIAENDGQNQEIQDLKDESLELKKILGAIVSKMNKKGKDEST